MDDLQNLPTEVLRTMTITAAAELARRWLPSVPGVPDHIAAGAETVMEVKLSPSIGVSLILVDSDGTRYPLAWRTH
jgi:hypothetical protein